jgi:hypothetical protein
MTQHDDEILRVTRAELKAAAELAATQALRARRRPAIALSAVVTFTICTVVFLIVALVAKDQIESTDHKANAYVCQVTRNVSTLLGSFVGSDATLRYRQAHLKVAEKLIAELPVPPADLKAAATASAALNAAYADYWYFTLQPELKALGDASCHTLTGR